MRAFLAHSLDEAMPIEDTTGDLINIFTVYGISAVHGTGGPGGYAGASGGCVDWLTGAIHGKPITLMVDTNHAYGRAEALRLGRTLEEYDLRWYEEPVVPEDIQGYVEMRQKLSMPIAGGENEHTLYGFREFLGAGAVDVAQPDLGSCGGISAGRHIIALAQSHGIQVNPHVWGSAIAQAASLQLIAALPVAHHSLFASEPILEYDRSTHPFRQYLITRPIQQVQGWVEVPSGPGLGVEVDREVLEKFRS